MQLVRPSQNESQRMPYETGVFRTSLVVLVAAGIPRQYLVMLKESTIWRSDLECTCALPINLLFHPIPSISQTHQHIHMYN